MPGYGRLKSSIVTSRREHELVELLDTPILLRDQASTQGTPYRIKTSPNPSWKFGTLYLLPGGLLFAQGNDVFFTIPLKKIARVSLGERKWLGRNTPKQLGIELSGGNRPFYIALTRSPPQIWKEAIEKLMEATEDGQSSGD